MSVAEWMLWITSTVFQGATLAVLVWEHRTAIKLRKAQIEAVRKSHV
jgi:hypothetical protein